MNLSTLERFAPRNTGVSGIIRSPDTFAFWSRMGGKTMLAQRTSTEGPAQFRHYTRPCRKLKFDQNEIALVGAQAARFPNLNVVHWQALRNSIRELLQIGIANNRGLRINRQRLMPWRTLGSISHSADRLILGSVLLVP
jgi:hypothetical protein